MSRREFQFSEGSSNKFWAIELDDKKHTVHFGRIGTAGQTQAKEFGSDAEAKKSYEKLIAEKVKKGYVEAGGETKSAGPATATITRKKKAKEAETPPAAPADKVVAVSPLAGVNTDITRTIDLEPTDFFWAGWRVWRAFPLPAAEEFDKHACLKRATALLVYTGDRTIKALGVPLNMTAEEARFWFEMLTRIDSGNPPARVAERLAKQNFDGLNLATIQARLRRWQGYQGNVLPLLRCLSVLLSPKEVLEVFLDIFSTGYWRSGTPFFLADGFTRMVLVYLSESDLKDLQKVVRSRLDLAVKPAKYHSYYPLMFHVAARLRCHEEMAQIVQSWPDDVYSNGWHGGGFYPEPTFIFGLGDPTRIEAEVRRLKMPFHHNGPNLLRALLATTGVRALDVARDAIASITNKDHCDEMLSIFTKVRAPEAAVHMLDLSQCAKFPRPAHSWLETEVGNAIAGLIPIAAGRGKLAEAAVAYLRDAKKKGHEKLIAACLKDANADVAEAVRKAVLGFAEKEYAPLKAAPLWLKKALDAAAKATPGKLPPWATPTAMAPILVGDKRLDDAQVLAVLHALQRSTLASVDPLIKALRENADPGALDAFAWKLFSLWQAEGASSKEKWAMAALGFFGGDESVLKLTPLVRAWPGESQHARAVFGLECLRAVGSDTALMQLNGIATKLKFAGLKNKAREFMEAIATDKGLTSAQLEDRIVPDYDLDARGSRVFDFGSRQFHFALGGDMKPMLKDADGKIRPDLPKPSGKDDAGKAEAAITEWKLLKKQVTEVAKIQAARLEQAMVTGRRWPLKDFETLLVKHPLMINLVRLVVWGGYDGRGKLATTFRVTEDQTYADAKDEATKLKGIDTVGIVHPLHLGEADKSSWGEVFSDYELVPPFPQLGRSIHALDKSELKGDRIKRFGKVKMPAATLIFGLENLGWTRGLVLDNGFCQGHGKYFPASDLTAVVHYDGFTVGWREGWEDQSILDIHFKKGQTRIGWYSSHRPDKGVPLSKVDPVVLSEVINDLTVLEAKGK